METMSIEILDSFAPADDSSVSRDLAGEFPDFQRKIVVLDDDPTGIQTVHDIFVYTDWSRETIREAFLDPSSMFFILTNSRSLSQADTSRIHREIAETVASVSRETGRDFLLLSRADSTLRGHYPLETALLRETLESSTDYSIDGEIFCPFFPEGGRYTINNIHYVQEGKQLVPAGETEFARDKTFSFHSSDLTEYIEEKTEGAFRKEGKAPSHPSRRRGGRVPWLPAR